MRKLPRVSARRKAALADELRTLEGIELRRAEVFLRLATPDLSRDQITALTQQKALLKQAEELLTKRLAEKEADKLEAVLALAEERDATKRGSALRSNLAIAPTPARRADPLQ